MNAFRSTLLALLAWPFLALAADEMPGRVFTTDEARPASLRVEEAQSVFRWDAYVPKAAPAGEKRMRVGTVREAPAVFAEPGWIAVEGGFVARFDVAAEGAAGLRVRLDLAGANGLELRVRDGAGAVEAMTVPAGASVAWGPWTEGGTQSVELFCARRPAAGAVRLGGIAHFDRTIAPKATAGACTVDVQCSTGNTALDAAIDERKKSMARITFVDGGSAYVCTGTLINSEKFPVPFFLTATHCIGRAEVAATISSNWFFEHTGCGVATTNPLARQVAGGMDIVFADPNTDHTLLQMRSTPPSGVTYAGWDATKLTQGASVVSLSHPEGDVAKWALATVSGTYRFPDWEQDAFLTTFSRGVIEGGSSGSGLFTLAGDGSLKLRAVLSATTVGANGGLSCTNTTEQGVYNRFDVFYPEVARLLQANPPPVADDYGNRPEEATLVNVGSGETTVSGRIDYPGDVDVFRIPVASAGALVARGGGGMDTVGVLLDANGERLTSNDDAQASSNDFGITYRVTPGTYYLAVTRWESAGTGPYSVAFSLLPVTDNYTDLWWNPAESGWGINVNHQGDTLFATLFTYQADGSPLWLVLANGAKQADGSYQGTLYRTSGPPFNAVPWSAVATSVVGTMRLAFPTTGTGQLTYTVNGTTVSKEIQRQKFAAGNTTCSWSVFDRTYADNVQDLWWNPSESGWGINFAQQGSTLFATLFTYGADGRGAWYVMSNGVDSSGKGDFSGTLYRTSGPAFNTVPWTSVTVTPVGTMTVSFSDGNHASLQYAVDGVSVTKSITRQVFGSPATECANNP